MGESLWNILTTQQNTIITFTIQQNIVEEFFAASNQAYFYTEFNGFAVNADLFFFGGYYDSNY